MRKIHLHIFVTTSFHMIFFIRFRKESRSVHDLFMGVSGTPIQKSSCTERDPVSFLGDPLVRGGSLPLPPLLIRSVVPDNEIFIADDRYR